MVSLVSRESFNQIVKQSCNVKLNKVDKKIVNVVVKGDAFSQEMEKKSGIAKESQELDGRPKREVPIEVQVEQARIRSILKSLKLHEDNHENILLDLQNRWLIGKKLPLYILFWMDTLEKLQNFKNQLMIGSEFNKEIKHFEITFYRSLQSFGLDDESAVLSNPFWLHPRNIKNEFIIGTKNLNMALINKKDEAILNFEKRFPGRKPVKNNLASKKVNRINAESLASKKFEPAQNHLDTIKSTHQLFLKLYENKHSRPLLITGEYVFVPQETKGKEIDFSDPRNQK